VSNVIGHLEHEFGKETAITVRRGKVHEYLGMTLHYRENGKVKISMEQYIDEMLAEMPEEMDGTTATPAANHLFQVDEDAELLDDDKKQFFHHNVAKTMYLSKRARPDLQTAVAYLSTRVTKPDTDDYKKLTRVVRYLRGTRDLGLTLEADKVLSVKWWVDASFGVHKDVKGHIGGVMSLGRGAIFSTSTKQKLNTRSSTECELVGVNDVMAQVLWNRYFLEAQGYDLEDNIVFQDNESAILLERNGRASSSKRTGHINIRYFFVQDHISAGEVSVTYCPTKEMVADYFTKPLQGSLFFKLRAYIMNEPVKSGSTLDSSAEPQECVEEV